MKIYYEIIDEYSKENQERTISFIEVLINLLEIHRKVGWAHWSEPKPKDHATIPFSSFEKQGFNPSETEFFIETINNLKTGGNKEGFLRHPETLIDIISFRLDWVNTPKPDLLKTNFYLELEDDAITISKSILKELIEKGYGGKEKKIKDANKTNLKINKKNKTISKDSGAENLVCSFRKASGKNKRFEYIVKLAQNEKIGGSKLSNTSPQNISTEIDKINKRLIDNLDLTHNVIKNDNNSGYEIDRDLYEPIFV